jgi:hypothetical protein
MSAWWRGRSGATEPSAGPDRIPGASSEQANLERTLSDSERRILERCGPYTMTSRARLLALVDAVHYVVRREIPGALVECGVWRGGSVLAMILALQELGRDDRDLYLYDTFEGMTAPTEHDTSPFHAPALSDWKTAREQNARPWEELFSQELFSRQFVEGVLFTTGYPRERLHFQEGDVLKTIPATTPSAIALLRLDTDWYESTRHELEHLYPRLARGGVLIVDDYGHWEGARRAVDEYFDERAPLLHRIDYTGRALVKE